MIALATADDESASPTPTRPASVCSLTISVSWLPSQRSLTSGRRRWMGSTRVIFTVSSLLQLAQVVLDGLELGLEVGHEVALLLHHLRRGLVHEVAVGQLAAGGLQVLQFLLPLLFQALFLGGHVD